MFALAASQTTLAEKAYWKGDVDSNWGEPKNWYWEREPSNRNLPTNDEMFFDNTGNYPNNEVVFDAAHGNSYRTFVNGVGTVETPLVFRATGSDCGLRFGNQNYRNPSCIGDSGNAYLCLKSGTWSASYLTLYNTAQLTLTDGASFNVSSDTVLDKSNCKFSITGGARFNNAAYFAHKAGEVKVENGILELGTEKNYEFGANAAANLLLNEGGLLIVRKIEKKTHGGTISFNGGILRSNRGSENLVDKEIAVTVGAKGGTIDNNGKDVIVDSTISGEGSMKFCGGGKVTLNKVNTYMGETKIAIRTQLVVTSDELMRLLENGGIMAVMPEGVSAKGTFKLLGKSDGNCTVEESALIKKGSGLDGAAFVIDVDGDISVTVSHTPQTWAGSAETSAPWSGNNWDASVAFEDGNDAVFATDGAIAEVDKDFSAYTLSFNENAALTGTGTLTVPTIAVAEGKTASIAGPLAGSMEKTGAGTLTLGYLRADTTTLTEGTLVANAPVGTLVLGTAAEKPVTFNYGGQSYSTSLADIDDGVNVTLTNGTFKIGFVKNGSLTIAADTIITRSGDIVVGQSTETGILTMNGGVISCSGKTYIGDTAGGKGDVKVIAGDLIISDDLRIGNKGEGTLTIKGGTVEVGSSEHQKWIYVGYDNGSTGVINLDGGQLKLWHVRKRNGTGAINLNGGKLVANGVSDDGLIDSKLSVTVGSNGGTIDANGHAITIATSIAGDGGMCYQGGGKVTLTVLPKYDGVTTVEVGTTLVIPEAIAHEKLAFSVPGELVNGVYTVVSISGDSRFADDVLSGKGAEFVLSADGKKICYVKGVETAKPTYIGTDGNLSAPGNWFDGNVPTDGKGEAQIFCSSATTLTVGDTFSPAKLVIPDGSALVTIGSGTLCVGEVVNRQLLAVGTGATVVIGDQLTLAKGESLCDQNNGTIVVSNLLLKAEDGDRFVTKNQVASASGVFKFNGVTNSMTKNWFYFADKSEATKSMFYIGADGLSFLNASGSAVYSLGRENNGNSTTIRPWYDDFTIADSGTGTYGLVFQRSVIFCTDDENDSGRTITIDAMTRAQKSSEVTVSGKGRLQINGTCDNSAEPPVTVKDTATLAFGAGASLGAGKITLGNDTKLVLTQPAGSNMFAPIANVVKLPTPGVATIRIDGARLKTGVHEIASVDLEAGSSANVKVDKNSSALDGRKATLRVEEGKLILNIVSDGTVIIVR